MFLLVQEARKLLKTPDLLLNTNWHVFMARRVVFAAHPLCHHCSIINRIIV